MVWINICINCRPITTQYFIAYNGITTPIDYWLQRAEWVDYFMLKQCLENVGDGLLHACISSKIGPTVITLAYRPSVLNPSVFCFLRRREIEFALAHRRLCRVQRLSQNAIDSPRRSTI